MTVTYFEDLDQFNTYAVKDYINIFRLKANRGIWEWEYIDRNTEHWDSIHQMIFRNYRANEIDPESLDHPLPELPEIPDKPIPKWGDQFKPDANILKGKYRNLISRLSDQDLAKCSSTVYVVLNEDQYESFMGDGKSLDFEIAFFDEGQANAFVKNNQRNGTAHHIRQFTLSWDEKHYFSDDFSPGVCEHYKLLEVLTSLARRGV